MEHRREGWNRWLIYLDKRRKERENAPYPKNFWRRSESISPISPPRSSPSSSCSSHRSNNTLKAESAVPLPSSSSISKSLTQVVGSNSSSPPLRKMNYGGLLLPGEGQAIAEYVASGKRVPRRGEVGINAEDIQRFESLGYVMSGNRNARMDAVRIRKESQVASAEEKRAQAIAAAQERQNREKKLIEELKEILKDDQTNFK